MTSSAPDASRRTPSRRTPTAAAAAGRRPRLPAPTELPSTEPHRGSGRRAELREHVAHEVQPVADPDRAVPRLLHDPAGHHDRERRHPADEPAPGCRSVRCAVDLERVHPGVRRAADHRRPPRRPVRPEATVPGRPDHLHRRLGRLRIRAEPDTDDHFPDRPGPRRRAVDSTDAVDDHDDLPAGEARRGVRPVGRGRRRVHGRRPDARRLARHRLQLAVDLLRERTGRRSSRWSSRRS